MQDGDGDFERVNYPLYVDVEEPNDATLSFSQVDPVAGQESAINVTVSNGDQQPLSNARLGLSGPATIENPERVTASLAAGTQTSHTYQVTFDDPGRRTLDATLTYETSAGYTRSVNGSLDVDVDAATVDTDLSVEAVEENGTSRIRATVTEYGNVELRDVQVRAVADGRTVARSLVPDVPAEGSKTVSLAVDDVSAGNVTVVADYTAAGERRTIDRTIRYTPAPNAAVTLTGVEVTRTNGVVTLDGDAANVGNADARSVLLSVVETDGVRPVPPKKEYFVGAIETSEFATFELTANVSADVDAVPVRVEYTVDGERVSEVVSVDVSGSTGGSDGQSGPGIGLPLVGIGAVLVALILLVGGVYAWRRR
ncbi:hypothetical protein VB773_22765 [Haloarculaceae archaeon H-GB2-1]|nr:hypothetical protein [Haloarculaceae archaeon H-GB11]MEA5410119.1 hypothetical protein [Haloarculaceae archaeon H-GB2-1]